MVPDKIQFDICLEEMRKLTKVLIWNRPFVGPKFEPKISWARSTTNDCDTLHFCSATYKILKSFIKRNDSVL